VGARNRIGIGLSYQPARVHRLAKLILWNRFLGPLKVYKFGLSPNDNKKAYSSLSNFIPYSEDPIKRSSTNLRTICGPHHQDFVISMTPKAIKLWNAIVCIFLEDYTCREDTVCGRKSKVWICYFCKRVRIRIQVGSIQVLRTGYIFWVGFLIWPEALSLRSCRMFSNRKEGQRTWICLP
jgi:hypothetical protein